MQHIQALLKQQREQMSAIALTAYAGETDYQQIIKAGVKKHITKPVDPTQLVTVIASLLNK